MLDTDTFVRKEISGVNGTARWAGSKKDSSYARKRKFHKRRRFCHLASHFLNLLAYLRPP